MDTVSDVSLFEPVMQAHQFKPTSDEIELAECIQRTTARKSAGSFSTDAARRVLKESSLSHRDIREICTIADRDGSGKLSHEELCAVIRLAGWVQQCGENVGEHLLATAGPLPVLKGIGCAPRSPEVRTPERDGPYGTHKPHDINITAPKLSEPQQTGVYHFDPLREWHQPRPVYPAINVAHMQICRSLFERAGPINGLMDKETAQEVLMTRFNAPFFLLKTIFNLVRTSNRLSLNIFEFTLAAYFVEGLRSGVINTLPSDVPRELYDQLWTPILLNAAPINAAIGADERRIETMVSADQSPVTSAQSSTSDLGLTAALRLSPVRKEPQPSFSGHCPSVSSTERKKISRLWKRVAEHCKIEKILKVSSTRNRKNRSRRESVLSSDASIKGTAYTVSSSDSSFEALERDSFLEPTMGQRVSMDMTRLPLIYPSETGFYTVAGPVPTEAPHSVGGELHRLDKVKRYSSIDYEEFHGDNLGETMSVISAFSLEGSVGYQAGGGKAEAETSPAADSDVVAMLKDMKEECMSLKRQMQIMHKTVQNLASNGRPITRNVHFVSDVGAELGERVRDSIQMTSGASRRTQSLKISKELVGPRDMLSIRSGSSISSSRSTSLVYRHDYPRRHEQRRKPNRVKGPRTRARDSESSSIYSRNSCMSLSDSESTSISEAPDCQGLPEVPDSSTSTTLPLRSILKVPAGRPQTRRIRIVDHDGHPSNAKSSPTTTPKRRKRATKRSGMTEETLQAWNARFIPVDRIIEGREGISVAKPSRKLPRTPRKLPTPGILPTSSKYSLSRHLPQLPAASSSKFPGAVVDEGCYASSQIDVDVESASYLDTELSHVDTDTVPSSAASTPRSSADLSSIFSHRRHSARTTLLTEIDEYNDTVVRDLKEVAPDLVLHVEKCLLRELRTKSDGMYDRMHSGLEALSQSSMAKELGEALAQVRAKEEELKRLEDFHAEVLRQRAREVTKLEQEKDELQWTIADQEHQICNLSMSAIAADLSIELPEYTPSSSTSGW